MSSLRRALKADLLEPMEQRIDATYRAGESWVMDAQHARYGTSLARIVFGFVTWMTIVVNIADRQVIWGTASRWQDPVRETSPWGFPFSLYNAGDPGWLFDLKLALPAIAGFLLMLGWRTRIMAIVTLFLMISLVQSSPVSLDQGDNAYRILLFFFCFTNMSSHWSLDARRRRRRTEAGKAPSRFLIAPDWLLNTLHNLGLVAISAQLFFIYVGAGLSKVQGSKWQHGTAIYYPLHVDKFDVWPALSNLLTGPGLMVGIVTYASVFIQIFFPLLLIRRWTRVIALLGIGGMHLGIAVLMGLPLFSLTMVAADVIFISDRTYGRLNSWIAARWQETTGPERAASISRRLRGRRSAPVSPVPASTDPAAYDSAASSAAAPADAASLDRASTDRASADRGSLDPAAQAPHDHGRDLRG